MKGKELFAVIDGIKKPLRQWADEYDMPYEILYDRYAWGWTGDMLFYPEPFDRLTPSLVHHIWGGRWVYRNELSRKNRKHESRWNDTTKWVYVGRRPVYT